MLAFGKTKSGFALDAQQVLRTPLDELFPFFADAKNLELLTPPFLRFEVTTKGPIAVQEGALIDYRLRLRGFPFGWRTRIATWEPPHRFVDEQLRGPYLLWRHEHRFERRGSDTLVIDHVDYKVFGGAYVNAVFVRPDLRRIFSYRSRQLAAHFGEAPSTVQAVVAGA